MAKNIAASRQKQPGGLSDKVSDIVLVVICAAVMLIVAYPLYYVLVASFSDPYDVYAGKTFLLPSQFTLKGYQAVFADSALFSGFMNSIKYTVIGTFHRCGSVQHGGQHHPAHHRQPHRQEGGRRQLCVKGASRYGKKHCSIPSKTARRSVR